MGTVSYPAIAGQARHLPAPAGTMARAMNCSRAWQRMVLMVNDFKSLRAVLCVATALSIGALAASPAAAQAVQDARRGHSALKRHTVRQDARRWERPQTRFGDGYGRFTYGYGRGYGWGDYGRGWGWGWGPGRGIAFGYTTGVVPYGSCGCDLY